LIAIQIAVDIGYFTYSCKPGRLYKPWRHRYSIKRSHQPDIDTLSQIIGKCPGITEQEAKLMSKSESKSKRLKRLIEQVAFEARGVSWNKKRCNEAYYFSYENAVSAANA
jgi:hypothetical protein